MQSSRSSISPLRRVRSLDMAGTRLYVQGIVLAELAAIVAWSVNFGICSISSNPCEAVWNLIQAPRAPLQTTLTKSPTLPRIQVIDQLHSDFPLEYDENPSVSLVCTQPESPVVQAHSVWFCPTQDAVPRVILRDSSMVIYGTEAHLETLLMPQISPSVHGLIAIHFVLEEQQSVTNRSQEKLIAVEEDLAALQARPCVDGFRVGIYTLSQRADIWESMEHQKESNSSSLHALDIKQVGAALSNFEISKSGVGIQIYMPTSAANSTKTLSAFSLEPNQLVLVGAWDQLSVNRWLAHRSGIDAEGWEIRQEMMHKLPKWFEEWYWYSEALAMTKKSFQSYQRAKHLLKRLLILDVGDDTHGHYDATRRLTEVVDLTLQKSTIEAEFPREQYAAIFAPLLFPLFIPFAAGCVKEISRYRTKQM